VSPPRASYDGLAAMETDMLNLGLFGIAFLYTAISVGAICNLFLRRRRRS